MLIGLSLYNFLSGGEVKQAITTKVQQILAGVSSSVTAPNDENQSLPKPINHQPKTIETKKPWYRNIIDNSFFQGGTNFVLDSIPIIGNIKAGYEAISGKDIFGNELSGVDRTISGVGILIPWAKHVKRTVNAVDEGIDIVRGASRGKPTRTGCTCPNSSGVTGNKFTPNEDGYFGIPGQGRGHTRNMTGGNAAAQDLFDQLSTEATRVENRGSVTIAFMPDGQRIVYRPTSSSDGTPVVEIHGTGQFKPQKIHFID